MDSVKFQRELEEYQRHVSRLKKMQGTLDTSCPHSLGLKHLASRPKKQQLVDDRNHTIAKENKTLMDRMTKLMTTKRSQGRYENTNSLNEVERRLEVDRLNMENRLLSERLSTVPATIPIKKMEHDFQKHLQVMEKMRRRQMKPLACAAGLSNHKPTFDSETYIGQNLTAGSTLQSTGLDIASPIQNMSDFRKHVMSTKKLNQDSLWSEERRVG